MTLADETKLRLYGEQARKLLPRGLAWTASKGTNFEGVLRGLGSEVAHADARAGDALLEVDPRTTEEMLADWERILDVPGNCGELAPNVTLRRFQLVTKLTAQGGQTTDYYVAQALALGFQIEIEEFPIFSAGNALAGNAMNTGGAVAAWHVHAPTHTPFLFSAGESGAGEALYELDTTVLECHLHAIKPAHTVLFFVYDLAFVGYAPWEELVVPAAALPLNAPNVIVTSYP